MKLGLYYRTVRHLTLRQIVFQVWNRLRGRPRLSWSGTLLSDNSEVAFPVTFTFLNQPVTFKAAIDWNYAANGKLWTYNLNYFEFLAHKTAGDGLALIHDFIRQTADLRDGLEPYPISLRVVHWWRFLRKHALQDAVVEQHLYAQTALLRSRLEYHLGGNHLLENACALTIMAVRVRHEGWFAKAARLLRAELAEQILSDGGHYERSPVYHQLLTDRLLDVYESLHPAQWHPDPTLTQLVADQIGLMLGWLQAVTFRNGDVPMVNDSAHGVAPTTAQLVAKATALRLKPTPVTLGESGYRMLKTSRLECFVDVGPVGPDHQPGHAHADTFSFVLYVDGQPVVVDPGTSTYQPGRTRTWERSTAAHNTVCVDAKDSSEVWGGFRVGDRARVTIRVDRDTELIAVHDGYKNSQDSYHLRAFTLVDENTLIIRDQMEGKNSKNRYRIFLSNSITLVGINDQILIHPIRIDYQSNHSVQVSHEAYQLATGFNRHVESHFLSMDFQGSLTTVFTVYT